MNPYAERCEKLIKEFDLKRNDFVDSTAIHGIILELLQKRCLKKRVALWGAGYKNSLTSHASVLLTKYATCLQGVVCLIDSCKELQGQLFMGHPIIAPEQLSEEQIDIVIISSRSSAESIRESLRRFGPDCECLDLYQELRSRGIDIPYNFYEERSFYSELYECRIAYEEAPEKDKAERLWKLIASYLHIHDFYYAFHYIDEYVKKGYASAGRLVEFQRRMQELLDELAGKNALRTQDITLHYIDALRAADVFDGEGKPYRVLDSYLKEAAVFTNCHSTAPTTYESMYSLTTGQSSYKENVYEDRFIFQPEEFEVMRLAMEKGYAVNLYTSSEWRIIREHKDVNYVNQIHMTDKLFTLACDMAAGGGPAFNYLYYPWELHFPLLCGYHRKKPVAKGFKDVGVVDMSDFIEDQFADCLSYVNLEFEYFKRLIPDGGYTVIFSDHSQIVYDPERCVPFYCYYNQVERATHCVLAIKGPGILHREYDGLVSLIDFNRIVADFVWNQIYEVAHKDVIQYQYYSTHNKVFRDIAQEKGFTDYIDGIRCFLSDRYLYTITKTGKEEVCRVENPKENVIGTPEGKRYAQHIRETCDLSFPAFLEIHY